MIEIVPKPKSKPKRIVNFLLYFSLVVLILVIITYFGLTVLEKQKNQQFDDLKSQLAAQQDTKELKERESELQGYEEKINDFASLFNTHKYSTKFFKFLGSVTYSKVRWTSLSLDIPKTKVNLKGKAKDFISLTKQLIILNREPKISNVKLIDLSGGKGEDVDFSLSFSLIPQIFLR